VYNSADISRGGKRKRKGKEAAEIIKTMILHLLNTSFPFLLTFFFSALFNKKTHGL
jgi:hypothetical protein